LTAACEDASALLLALGGGLGGRRRPRACPQRQRSRHSWSGPVWRVPSVETSLDAGGKNAWATKSSWSLPLVARRVVNAIVHSEAI